MSSQPGMLAPAGCSVRLLEKPKLREGPPASDDGQQGRLDLLSCPLMSYVDRQQTGGCPCSERNLEGAKPKLQKMPEIPGAAFGGSEGAVEPWYRAALVMVTRPVEGYMKRLYCVQRCLGRLLLPHFQFEFAVKFLEGSHLRPSS